MSKSKCNVLLREKRRFSMITKCFYKIVFAILAVSTNAALAQEECRNCSAEVVIESHQAQRFTFDLMLISSMPLNGQIIEADPVTQESTVLVSTCSDYAQSNGINSFDVAKLVMGFVGGEYRIKEVRAVVRPSLSSDSLSNVGTIGHR